MTTFNFSPSEVAPYQFQPTLDGQVYNAVVTWNVFGQRYYLNLYDLTGALVLATAMVGSPLDYDISLVAGYFDSKLVYRVSNQQIVVTP